MDILSENIISKFESVVVTIFLIFVVLLFSSVSSLSKIILSFLLIIIFITRIYLTKNFLLNLQIKKHSLIIFITILLFLFYLFFNTYFVSKIHFESKTELLNFCFYTLTFLVFYLISIQKSLMKEIFTSFLFVETILFLAYIFSGEKIINFFIYNQNILAGYCLLSWLFSFFYLYERKQKYKFVVVTTFIISSVFLILLKSFSAIFISAATLVFVFLKNKLIKYSIVVSLLLIFIVLNFNSFVDRSIWIVIGTKIWVQHFFFGIGLGNFKFYYSQYLTNIWIEPSIATVFVHNYFVQLASETGVIGIFIFLFFIYYILKNSKNKIFVYPLYGIILQNFVDYVLYIPQNSILFFIFLSSLSAEIEIKDSCSIGQKNKNVLLYILCIVFLLTYCIISFIKMDKIMLLINSNQKNCFYKTVSLDKTYWFGWKKIAVSLVDEGKLEQAKEMFENVIKTNPLDAESYLYLAIINFKLGNKSVGYKILKQMLIFNPKMGNKYIKILRSEFK